MQRLSWLGLLAIIMMPHCACALNYLQAGAACRTDDSNNFCIPPLTCIPNSSWTTYGFCMLRCDDAINLDTVNNLTALIPLEWSKGPDVSDEEISCKTCDVADECPEDHAYRCAPGYYGPHTMDYSRCTMCPDSGSSDPMNLSTNVGYTNEDITGCYLAPGITYTDTAGQFTVSEKCYYKM